MTTRIRSSQPDSQSDSYFTLKAWNAQKAGAAAILVADDRSETLITMDMPEAESAPADYLQNISIHSALISKSLGDAIKKALNKGEMVNIKLNWTETLPYPDERVEYEFWTNSNDECGTKCDSRINFVKDFKGAAQTLEKKKVGLLSQKKLNIWMDFPWLKTSAVLFVPASMARQPLLCIPFS